MALNNFESEYQLSDYYGECFVCWREWLSKEDSLKGISNEDVDKIVNAVLEEEMPMPYSERIKKRGLVKLIDVSKFDKIISALPNYNSIDNLDSIVKIGQIEETGVNGGIDSNYREQGNINIGIGLGEGVEEGVTTEIAGEEGVSVVAEGGETVALGCVAGGSV
jgi:hypothetical protein